jgi:hypothetical protein
MSKNLKFKNFKLIPPNIAKLVDPTHRKERGIETYEDIARSAERLLEKQLHDRIMNLFRLHGIAYGHARMDRKSTYTEGWPDFTFSVYVPKICENASYAWECKVMDRSLTPKQEEMKQIMTSPPNAWVYVVITSFQQACDELKELGI